MTKCAWLFGTMCAACGGKAIVDGAPGSGGAAGSSSVGSSTSTTAAQSTVGVVAVAAASSSSGTGGSGGTAIVNGCTEASAKDETKKKSVAIEFGNSFKYSPACLKVTAGADVVWFSNDSSFGSHPLLGGTVVQGIPKPDGSGPIKATTSGTKAGYSFPTPGAYGYYCGKHFGAGMKGAIFVVP